MATLMTLINVLKRKRQFKATKLCFIPEAVNALDALFCKIARLLNNLRSLKQKIV